MKQSAISDQEFSQFQQFLYRIAGIKLSDAKKELVCGRLSSRLRKYGLTSYGEYFRLLSSQQDEMQVAVDLLTTNETYFFREASHFSFVRDQILPHVIAGPGRPPFRVWSAACSSGEEVYSLAMLLSDRLGASPWEIIGSDLSTRVLEQACAGRYPMERTRDIPPSYLKQYCLKGVRSQQGTLLIGDKLRRRTRFLQVNLNEELPNLGQIDLIFLRNVLIYFDQQTKEQVVTRLLGRLRPGGHLIVGHSETLTGFKLQLVMCAPTVYQKPAEATPETGTGTGPEGKPGSKHGSKHP